MSRTFPTLLTRFQVANTARKLHDTAQKHLNIQ